MVEDFSKAVSFGPTEAVAGIALRILETMKDVDDNDKECIKLMKKVVDFILIIQEEFDNCRAILIVSPNLSSQMDKFKDILYTIYEDPRICEKSGYGKRFINSAGTKTILADYSADLDSAISRVSFSLLLGIATGINRLHTQNLHNLCTSPDDARRTLRRPLRDRVFLIRADITSLRVDAIVNAANTTLLGGSSCSVDGAIHSAAGEGLYHECKRLNGCAMGDAKITTGHNLPAPYVIHTAGPVYRARHAYKAASLLASCYRKSLRLAVDYRLHHIAFPAISTGANGYPYEDAARIALGETRKFLSSSEGQQIDLVIFTTFKEKELSVYKRLIPEFFPASV